jgi:hypothetical protein
VAAFLVLSISAGQNAGAAERIDVMLASVLPPSGSGWTQFREHPGKVSLGKLGAASGQSFAGTVLLTKLPALKSKEEFFALVSRQRARDSSDTRFEDLVRDETVSIHDGVWVVRFHVKYKDFGANNRPKTAHYLIAEEFGAVFRHPFEDGVAVYVALSQRSLPQDLDESFEKLAKKFVASVEFRSGPIR